MNTVHEKDVAWLNLPGRRCRVMVGGSGLKADHLTFGVTEVPPQSIMTSHTHGKEEEIIYILKGWGVAVVDGKAEPIEEGSAICLPAGSEHYIENKSDKTMKFTFAFSPPVKIGSYDS